MKAYELIDTPEKWCQGYSAEKKGRPCFHYDPGADKFCLIGSVWKAYGTDNGQDSPLLARIAHKLGTWEIARWNDCGGRTQKEVYDLLKSLDI